MAPLSKTKIQIKTVDQIIKSPKKGALIRLSNLPNRHQKIINKKSQKRTVERKFVKMF
jgi:hypothetical protein